MNKTYAALAVFAVATHALFAQTRYVAPPGQGGVAGNDGLSFDTPMASIQDAVNALGGGGRVVVSNGVYNVTQAVSITGSATVTVQGFTKNPADVVVKRNPSVANTRIFLINNPNARLEFVTVRDGTGNGDGGPGGNILLENGTVADCVIENGKNEVTNYYGGNIGVRGSGRVLRCVIAGGRVNAPADTACTGAAVLMNGAGALVEQCLITNNTSAANSGDAAVVFINASGGNLVNCTVARNSTANGGAIRIQGSSPGKVVNCVIVDNTTLNNPPQSGGSVFDGQRAEQFVNCVTDVLKINSTCATTAGDFGFVDQANGDYRLTDAALALDFGDAAFPLASTTDLLGNPRVSGSKVDAGCYEYLVKTLFVTFEATGPRAQRTPFTAHFAAQAFNAAGEVEYAWDFGDGTPWVTNTGVATASHLYEIPGKYTVAVHVDDGSDTASMSRPDYIHAIPVQTVYVAPPASGGHDANNDGTSFASPKATVTGALAALDPEAIGVIVLSNGTYTVGAAVTLDRAVTVRGASGNRAEVVVGRNLGVEWIHVFTLNHPDARLESLTLRDGRHTTYGNLYITGAGGTASNCVITAGGTGNAWNHTGGIYMDGGLVTHCVISNCKNNGAYNVDAAAGVRISRGSLEHCLITGNTVEGIQSDVGGVYMTGGSVVNCTITKNSSSKHGGIYALGGTVLNTVIAGNTSVLNPGSASEWGGNSNCFVNCFTDTAAAVNASCHTQPASFLFADFAGGDYSPAVGSPLVGASVPISNTPAVDLNGNPRVRPDGSMDAGCHQADLDVFAVSFAADNLVGLATESDPAVVNFTAAVSGTNGSDVLHYLWDFDDGAGEVCTNLSEFAYFYGLGGYYNVTFIATNTTAGGAASARSRPKLLRFAPPVLYVDSANGVNAAVPFHTWGNASAGIQAAVNLAVDGCEIVLRGNYTVQLQRESSGIVLEKALRVRSEFNDPADVVIQTPAGSNHRVLYVQNASAWVSGVTIQARETTVSGSGVLFYTLGGTVSNCVIRGGGVGSNATGAAASLNSVNALLTHCEITGNHTTENDGENRFDQAIIRLNNGRVENCLVHGNSVSKANAIRSGVIEIHNNGTVRNCTIVDNVSANRGVISGPGGQAFHCVIAGNREVSGQGGGPSPLFTDTDRVHQSTVDHAMANNTCRVQPAADIFKQYAAKNYRLGPLSFAVNAGPRLAEITFPIPSVDLDNRPRVLGGKLDHGCYEANPPGTLLLVK